VGIILLTLHKPRSSPQTLLPRRLRFPLRSQLPQSQRRSLRMHNTHPPTQSRRGLFYASPGIR
jgi:hypothetical protein